MAGLLEVRDIRTEISTRRGPIRVVDGVSLNVDRGEVVGLVGESGCGKSMTAFSILRLFPTAAASIAAGQVLLNGINLATLDERGLQAVRGARVGMIFQDPTTYLDPLMRVGDQVSESLRAHGHRDDAANRRRVLELLELMDLSDPPSVALRYPHELSGGQRQRVLIAAALALEPDLLIADEPTTSLDVTVQASILNLLVRLRNTLGLGLLLITHDLGVVAEVCDRVYVMYAGRVVETNTAAGLFATPRHPYTQGLLKGTLSAEGRSGELFSIPGVVPDPRAMPAGCRFAPRCPLALLEPCVHNDPSLWERPGGGSDACWRALEPVAAQSWEPVP